MSVQGGSMDLRATTGQPVQEESLGQLFGELTRDLSTLMRKELELAKVEMTEEAGKAGKAAGMLGGAGVAANLALVFVSIALAWGLDSFLPVGVAFLVVGVLWAAVAAILAVVGRNRLRAVRPVPDQTVETLKEDVQWARAQRS